MSSLPPSDDRRRYRRVDVPVYYRGARLFGARRSTTQDVSLGGIRIATDDALKVGKRIEIELFFPGDVSVTCDVRVAWVRETTAPSAARYEAGLQFVGLDEEDAALLRHFLETGNEDEDG